MFAAAGLHTVELPVVHATAVVPCIGHAAPPGVQVWVHSMTPRLLNMRHVPDMHWVFAVQRS